MREKYDAIKAECDLQTDIQTKGAQIRARVKWIEEGEKNNSYFFNLEKARGAMNAIFILKQSDNTLTKDLDEIMNLLHTFYEKLYKENSRFDEKKYKDFISELNVPNLSEEEAGSCAGLLTDMECAQVLS